MDVLNGLDEYNSILSKFESIKTGIEGFDNLMQNENLQGKIIEICGVPGVGKTQLTQTIMRNIVRDKQIEALLINTKCDFSVDRFNKMVGGISAADKDLVLGNIKIENIFSADKFVKCLRLLRNRAKIDFQKLRLLIIDSLPPLFLHYTFAQNDQRRKRLMETGRLLRQLAYEHQMIILVTNYTNDDAMDKKFEEKSIRRRIVGDQVELELEPFHQALGPQWYQVPNYRFLIAFDHSKSGEYRKIITWEGTNLKEGTMCLIEITDTGVI